MGVAGTAWPGGTLLRVADAEVVDTVRPRPGPDRRGLLAACLLRYDRTPRVTLDRLLSGRDREAARPRRPVPLDEAVRGSDRLIDLDDLDVDLALLRHRLPRTAVHRIVARSRPGAGRPLLAARVRPSGVPGAPPGRPAARCGCVPPNPAPCMSCSKERARGLGSGTNWSAACACSSTAVPTGWRGWWGGTGWGPPPL
ncbi:hypothetical protein [Streptomyces murinus]